MKKTAGTRSRTLTMVEIDRINAASDMKAQRVANKIAAALRISADADVDARLKANLCRGCFYTGSQLAGQAFTQWTCLLCPETGRHHNTAVPRVCSTCCDAYGLCAQCGGDIEMCRRSRFDRTERKPRKEAKCDTGLKTETCPVCFPTGDKKDDMLRPLCPKHWTELKETFDTEGFLTKIREAREKARAELDKSRYNGVRLWKKRPPNRQY